MKRTSIIGLCVAAVCALSLVAVAGASAAAPEIGRCLKQAGGKYENSGCTKEAKEASKQKFEWTNTIVKNKFKGHLSTGIATLETEAGTKITCKHSTSENAEYNSPKTIRNLVADFTECESGGVPCNSATGKSGEIITKPLEGELGVEKLGTTPPINNKLGFVLFGPAHGNLAEFECTSVLTVVVRGSVIHPVKAGSMLLTSTEKFTATKAEQKPDKFVGEGVDAHTLESSLKGAPFEESGQTITALLENEEKLEANPAV